MAILFMPECSSVRSIRSTVVHTLLVLGDRNFWKTPGVSRDLAMWTLPTGYTETLQGPGFALRIPRMKSLRILVALMCAPILLATSLNAAEKDKKAPAATNKPSLTYYFFDG